MKFSKFGTRFTTQTGIGELMDDLGNAMSGTEKMLMLGGGNPAHIPEVQKIFKEQMQTILQTPGAFENMIGNYTTPQGDTEYLNELAAFFNRNYNFNITSKNIAILNGGQTAFFFLFNMIAGEFEDGAVKKILLPIVPEYIGYADQGLNRDFFAASKPSIEYIDDHTFKYHVDFKNLNITKDIAAMCVSRPTNPTGNVITDEEVEHLSQLAKTNNIPLIVDNAYGAPFPNILFTKITPTWDNNMIFVLSLSKFGLPNARTSMVIAHEEIIAGLSRINAIASLASGRFGQQLILPLLKNDKVLEMSKQMIQPFYQKRAEQAIEHFHKHMDQKLPYYLHKSEGAIFLWLWCKDLPISSHELYERIKKQGVLVVSGEYFFPGLQEKWKHTQECIRITYSQNEDDVKRGLEIIAEQIKKAYNQS